MATLFDDLPDIEPGNSGVFDDLPDKDVVGETTGAFDDLPNVSMEPPAPPFAAPSVPPSDILREQLPPVGISREVAGIAGEDVPRMPPDAMARAREEVVNDLAAAGVGLQQGFHALGEQGWTGVQAANEPLFQVGPVAFTGSGIKPAGFARTAAEGAREIALEARRKSEELQPLAEDLIREGASPISQSVGQAIPSLAPAFATGPLGRVATIATSGLQQGLSTLSEAQSVYDVDPETTDGGVVIPNGAFRRALLPAIADTVTTAGITALSGKLFGDAVEGATLPARRELIKSKLNEIVMGAIGEGLEEGAQQFVSDYVIGKLSYKPDTTLDQAISDALKAGIAGGILGGAATGLRFTSDPDDPKKVQSNELAKLLRESVKRSTIDQEAIDDVSRARLSPPQVPVPEGTRIETGPGVRRVIAPTPPTGETFPADPNAPAPAPAFNTGEATPFLKDNVGRQFRTADGRVGELKRDEAGRFVIDDGSTLTELNVGPEGTAGEAGVSMLKSNYAPSKLKVSREQARLRQLANWARKFPQPPPPPPVKPPVPGAKPPKVEKPHPHPEHVKLINAVAKVIQNKNATQGEYLGALEAIPVTRRIVEGQIERMEATGAKPSETQFYYALLERMEQFENQYLEGITKPRSKAAQAEEQLGPNMATARKIADMTPDEFLKNASAFNKWNIELGQKATLEEYEELKRLRDKAQERLKKAFAAVEADRNPQTLRELSVLSTMPQFYNEAIAEYEKKNGKPPEPPPKAPEPPAKPPVIDKVRAARANRSSLAFDWETENGGPDILSWIKENMPLLSKSRAKALGPERWKKIAPEYDDSAPLARVHHNLIYRGDSRPDQVAQAAYEAGVLKEASVPLLWSEIDKASKTRAGLREMSKDEAAQIELDAQFYEATHPTSAQAEDEVLAAGQHFQAGDEFQVGDSKFKVVRIDANTGDVVVDDGGTKYGRRRIGQNEQVRVKNPSEGLLERIAESPDLSEETPVADSDFADDEPEMMTAEEFSAYEESLPAHEKPFVPASENPFKTALTGHAAVAYRAKEAGKPISTDAQEALDSQIKRAEEARKAKSDWDALTEEERNRIIKERRDKAIAEQNKVSGPPKLRPGEKKTGELFQKKDQPFNLGTDVTEDGDRIAREKAEAEQRAREAAEAEAKAQQNLSIEEPSQLVSDEQADAIKARLQKRFKKGDAGSSGIQASVQGSLLGEEPKPSRIKMETQDFNDAVELGVHFIQKGAHKFDEFSKRMLEVFGPDIEGHLKSIYETARVTIESPGSKSITGRSPGLQPGLKPPSERIITARAEFTKPVSEDDIHENLRKHLDAHQRQGAATAIRSLEEQGGFLNADGTGVGKTRQALAVAYFYAKKGFKVIIVTKAETIKPNWANDTFGGSYFADSQAMGVPLKLAREAFVRPGEIGITTYENLNHVKATTDQNTFLIFDEAHAMKNDSVRSRHAMEAVAKATKVMYMSATPADKAEHIYYLAPIGIMEGKSTEDQLRHLGLKVTSKDQYVKVNGVLTKQKVIRWSVDPKVPVSERRKRFNELFDRMTSAGRMIKREISLEGVHIQVLNLTLPPEAHQLQSDIVDKALEVWEKESWKELSGLQRAIVLGHQRRQQEPFKIAAAVMLAKRELAAGRQVVLFIHRVNESEVGFNKKVRNPLGGESITVRETLMSSEGTAKTLRDALHEAGIHDIAEIHGNSDQNSLDAMADFQSGKKRVTIATIESGGTGINLDDIVGNAPRSMIVVTAPFDAVGNVQAAGRIWRLKTLSGANMFYLLGDTKIDQWNFGIIGGKMQTLGAVVEGQVGKLNIDNPDAVITDLFEEQVEDPGENEGPVGPFPKMDWKSRAMGPASIKYVAPATDEFWDWWRANGREKNPFGLTIHKRGENDWVVWSEKPIEPGESTPPPVIGEDGGIAESAPLEGIAGTTVGIGATTTPSPITTSTLPPKSQREIITDIAKALKIPIRFGRLVSRRAGGYFRPVSRYITSRRADDIPVVAHEAGHALDEDFGIRTQPALKTELMKLGDPAAYPGSRSSMTPSKTKDYQLGEGFAEFMRYWFTNPSFAKQEAPKTWAHFEGILAANEDLGTLLRKAQSDIGVWIASPNAARFRSQVSRDSDPLKQSYTASHLTRDLVDRLEFFRLATETAKANLPPGDNLAPSRDLYLLARNLSGSSGIAKTFIRNGTVDFRTREVTLGKSLEDALKPVAGRTVDFGDWILAVRARELQRQGKVSGFLPQDVDAVYNKHKDDADFQNAWKAVQEWQENLLKFAQDSGLIDSGAVAEFRRLNRDYVPYHRVFEVGAGEAPAMGQSGSGPAMNVTRVSSLRGLKGSTRQVIDPLESMVQNAVALVHASEKAAIANTLASYAYLPKMGEWVRVVDVPKEKVRADLKRFRQALMKASTAGLTAQEQEDLEDAIAHLEKLPDDLLLSFWRVANIDFGGKKMNVIRVMYHGQPRYLQLKKELYETFNGLDQEQMSRAVEIMGHPAQWLRSGTVLETGFAIANVFKDQFSSAIINRHGLLPFEAMIKGLNAMIRNPKLVAEWAAAGGELATEADFYDRQNMRRFLAEKITKDLTPAERALIWVKSPLAAMRFLTAAGEEATRIGEFKTAYDDLVKHGVPPGEARRLAAFEARDRQDFAKGGAQTKILRYITPFWNAGLQANVAMYKAFKQRPIRTSMQGLMYLTLPKLLEMALSWDDDDYWDRPQWERDAFFLIPIGKSESGHTKFLRLPNVHLPGLIFATIPGRIVTGIRNKDKKALDGVMKQFLQETIPNPVPPGIVTGFELNTGEQGWNYWLQKDIVPDRLANLPAPEQFTEQTTEMAKATGKLIGVSPMKVDHFVTKSFGGLGRVATGQQTPARRFQAPPLETSNQASEDFYAALKQQEKLHASARAKDEDSAVPEVLSRLRSEAKELSDLRRQVRQAKSEAEKVSLRNEIFELTKQAVARYKSDTQ